METLPEPLANLLTWKEERDRERRLRNVQALKAPETRAPPPPPPARLPERLAQNEPPSSPAPARSSPGWRHLTAPEDLPEALEALAGASFLAIDIETSGLDPLRDSIRLIQLAAPGTLAYLIDLPGIPEAERSGLREILAGPIPKTFVYGIVGKTAGGPRF